MPITFGWYDDDRIIVHIQFIDHWTWSEYLDIQLKVHALIAEVPNKIIYFGDMRRCPMIPVGAMIYLPFVFRRTHPRRLATIIIGANEVSRRILSLISSYSGTSGAPRYHFTDTLEQAEHLAQSLELVADS